MSVGVLLALGGPEESALVKALDTPGSGVRVVRRCADLPEVLAAAAAGLGRVAVLAADVPGVDRPAVGRLRVAGVRTVLVAAAGDRARCAALGADAVEPPDVTALAAVVSALARDVGPRQDGPAGTSDGAADDDGDVGVAGDPPAGLVGPAQSEPTAQEPAGRLVAVWGPPGAPGRTTVAVGLAAELAALGSALLVDADTEAPAVTQLLGLLDDSSAVAAAARHAAHGRLDPETLLRLSPQVEPGLRVLTGLTRADRWRELPAASLEVVWDVARRCAPWTVVDLGPGLDDGGTDPSFGPRRHQATASALRAADVVVVVGAGEPVGMRRLVMALGDLTDAGLTNPTAQRVVVVNRVRAAAAGPHPEQSVHEALARFAGVGDAVVVPDDRPALDKAVLLGRTLRDLAPASPARLALEGLALRIAGHPQPRRRARRGTGLRRPSMARSR